MLGAAALACAPFAICDPGSIDEIVVTAARGPLPELRLPYSIHVVDRQQIVERQYRTLPQALRGVPGVMVQETAFGQGSPYLRGFTGFRTLFLQDGVRLNNSVFRDGPNQYGTTIDLFAADRLEVVQGPASTLYGSDAIGGTVQALSPDPASAVPRAVVRMASAEESLLGRLEFAVQPDARTALAGGLTGRASGELHGGRKVGRQPGVGYQEQGADLRAIHRRENGWVLEAAGKALVQNNVPRTHATREAVAWHGTSSGRDLKRELDQERLFTYLRLGNAGLDGPLDSLSLTAAFSRTREVQDRIRSSGSREKQGFTVDTLGLLAGARSETALGSLTWGIDYYRDEVDSFSSANAIQGPVADDAAYRNLDVYLLDRIGWLDRGQLVIGVRHTRVGVDADRVRDPVTGEAYSIDERWSATVGSAGLSWTFVPDRVIGFANAAEGFRAPNLSDLSRFDSARSNEIEIPVTGLDEERYLSMEAGIKVRGPRLQLKLAVFRIRMEDLIQRVPTGSIIGGEHAVSKANLGDGRVEGVEASWRAQIGHRLELSGHATWMDGRAETYPTSAPVIEEEPLDRLMPLSAGLSFRFAASDRFWLEAELSAAAGQRDLSSRDAADTSRIPPGGTPGYLVTHARAGLRLAERLGLVVGLENLADIDYRIHGSGTNMPGRNLILTLDMAL